MLNMLLNVKVKSLPKTKARYSKFIIFMLIQWFKKFQAEFFSVVSNVLDRCSRHVPKVIFGLMVQKFQNCKQYLEELRNYVKLHGVWLTFTLWLKAILILVREKFNLIMERFVEGFLSFYDEYFLAGSTIVLLEVLHCYFHYHLLLDSPKFTFEHLQYCAWHDIILLFINLLSYSRLVRLAFFVVFGTWFILYLAELKAKVFLNPEWYPICASFLEFFEKVARESWNCIRMKVKFVFSYIKSYFVK